MNLLETETLIIGAGPAGMAAAMELSKAGKAFILIEKDARVGGLSKTYRFEEKDGSVFYTDNGPHRFFSKNPYLYEFIGDLLQDDWIKVQRQTRQFIDGKFYDYPINALQALRNIGFLKAVRMLIDYCWAQFMYGFLKKDITTFEDYVVAHFGRSLAEFNMINYTEKIWGIPARDIHPDWAGQRIKGLSVTTIVKSIFSRLFGSKKTKTASLVDEFYYPRKGTGQIYETIKTKLIEKGYIVMTETLPTKVEKIPQGFKVELKNAQGMMMTVVSKYLVESVPIKQFVHLIEDTKTTVVTEALEKLKYRSQVYIFVTLNKEHITADQWIYFPSKNIPFARVSEMKNFSSYMSPKGKTSLFIEIFCFEGDSVWNMTEKELFKYIEPHFNQLGFFSKKDIRSYYVIRQKDVYPIYDVAYKTYLGVVKDYLNTIPNLFYIGRPGRFRYNNQDHSLEMGIQAARSIIDQTVYDIESIGEEKKYFEAGTLYQKKTTKV